MEKAEMVKATELFVDMTSEVAREKLGLTTKFHARELTDENEITEARKLAIGEFAKLGKISKEEVDDNGLLKFDPFLLKSTFFGVYDNDDNIGAAARLIWREDTTVEDMRLPTEKIDPLHADFLHSLEPGTVAEIGSLAKRSGTPNVATLKLLREMFAFAREHGITDFVCGLEPKLYPAYKKMFGGSLQRMHTDTIEFPGIEGEQVPLRINVEDALSYDFEKMQARSLGSKAVGASIRFFFRSRRIES